MKAAECPSHSAQLTAAERTHRAYRLATETPATHHTKQAAGSLQMLLRLWYPCANLGLPNMHVPFGGGSALAQGARLQRQAVVWPYRNAGNIVATPTNCGNVVVWAANARRRFSLTKTHGSPNQTATQHMTGWAEGEHCIERSSAQCGR